VTPRNLAQGVPKWCHPSAKLWCHITEDPLSVSSDIFIMAAFQILVFCDVMLHDWMRGSCKQHVPSKHRMPGLTQWHGSTSQKTGICEKLNRHVQTVCSLPVRLNMNIYILCAMANVHWPNLPSTQLIHELKILPSRIHVDTHTVLERGIICFQGKSLIT